MGLSNRRERFRIGLNDLYLPSYDKLCAILPGVWQPYSGYRTFDEQSQLYMSGRKIKGPIKTKADAGLSFHNYGLATDWWKFEIVNGKEVMDNLRFDAPEWKEYTDACESVGLRCLAWERPHNELVIGTKIAILLSAYNRDGIEAVNALIKGEK